MAQAKFSIGIDLGTSNSALAFSLLTGEGGSEVLAIPQWDTASTATHSFTLPSFLYLPEEAIATQIRGRGLSCGEWVVGRLAQRKASETPGRVAHSAKSWLCHHAADRSAPFLPWGSDELTQQDKISPVFASALILEHLRAAWDARFAGQGPGFQFDTQEITITVPASFDAAAQRLTLAAVQEAGFPDHTRLLEEPQAAFYRWLEQQGGCDDPWSDRRDGVHHVLVIDVGGGTSDFSLFELSLLDGSRDLRIKRVAVSNHILLGGDNIDLAIAHLLEPRLVSGEIALSAGQWDHLVARCRSLKESVLGYEGAPDEVFTVSVPGRSSRLIAGSLSAQLTCMELEELVLNGFFPGCRATDRPRRALGAVREWGLPYAFDSAVTRHLAEFLHGRPRVDAVLFNGSSLFPQRLRDRLCEQIGLWQEGHRPEVLENAELDLAVARGAAYFGKLMLFEARRIEAGAARAVFLETHREAAHSKSRDEAARRSLVCILPLGAPHVDAFIDEIDHAISKHHFHRDTGIAPQIVQHHRQDMQPSEDHGSREHQFAARRVFLAGKPGLRSFQLAQQAPASFEVVAPCICQGEVSRGADDKRRAHMLLERCELPAHRREGNIQLPARRGQAAGFGDGSEYLDGTQPVHSILPFYGRKLPKLNG